MGRACARDREAVARFKTARLVGCCTSCNDIVFYSCKITSSDIMDATCHESQKAFQLSVVWP